MAAAASCEPDFERIAGLYAWSGNPHGFGWADPKALRQVWDYLHHWETVPYWIPVPHGGPRGFSLFLHEWVEICAYRERGADPWITSDQLAHYEACHARALLAEHRFLEAVSASMGVPLTVHELVAWNPHGTPEWDWQLLTSEMDDALGKADRGFHAERQVQARRFFGELGFQEASSYAE